MCIFEAIFDKDLNNLCLFLVNWENVSLQTSFFWKAGFTNWALVWFSFLMNWFDVISQTSFLWKAAVTNWALMRFLFFMNHVRVFFQMCFPRKGAITNWTLVWLFSLMNGFNMCSQTSYGCIRKWSTYVAFFPSWAESIWRFRFPFTEEA